MGRVRHIIRQRVQQKKEGTSHPKPEVLPTERVKRICATIGLLGCASLEQLHKAESPDTTKQSFRNKMNDLVKAGYIKTKTVDARHTPEVVYYLSRSQKTRGLFAFDEWKALQAAMPSTSELRSVLRTHDILQKVGERFHIVSFVTEHQLKSIKSLSGRYHTGPQVTDGTLTLQRSEGESPPVTVAIEVDGNYHGKSLRSKIASLGKSGQRVLWVAYSQVRVERLVALCQEERNITPVLFTNLNNILETLW